MKDHVELRSGLYRDSVTLMQVSRTLAAVPGVRSAQVAMATGLNLDVIAEMGFERPAGSGPNDLVIAIRAESDESCSVALAAFESALAPRPLRGGSEQAVPPRTTGSAARALRDASIALISVPGAWAFAEAMDALECGLSVMVFSDNVPLDQEIRLKDEAGARELLVMGPDCGTASIGGVGFGFSNVVRSGPVGLVAASGTGAQQLMCLLDAAGVGVSHCLGVGGRDLSAPVGARSTLRAMVALDADPATGHIVVVSKPPNAAVAERVISHVSSLQTPVTFAFLGHDRPNLTQVAESVISACGASSTEWSRWMPASTRPVAGETLRGLFCGGTLCDEAMVIAAAELGPISSNIPLEPAWALPDDLQSDGHVMIDFGDDRLTQGRSHPMIDPSLRLDRLATELADPRTGVMLLDVVLGHASHPDPAPDLAALIAAATVPVVVSLCGTESDPQGLGRQAEILRDAGANVFLSNAAAAVFASELIKAANGRRNE